MKIKENIKCIACNKPFKNRRGIAVHVFRHSEICLKTYIKVYGFNRWNWPEYTLLNLKKCIDCGEPLKDPRSRNFCQSCQNNSHNVMKRIDVIRKNIETNKPIKNSDRYRKLRSEISIKAHKENPELSIKKRNYMLNGGALKARKGIKNPSKPQLKLFNMVNDLFPNSIINYDVIGTYNDKKFQFEVDIVIKNRKIIIEYDEPYWHKDKKYDRDRQEKIESVGWKFLRYEKIPTIDKLKLDISRL